MENKLFLLDAYALIYRAYYALIKAPRITSKGFNTSAIYGFCNTLDEVLKKENPTHIAVCFDPSGPTFRHTVYEEYKANREKQPEDITLALPYIKDILEAKGIKSIEVPGYEADDVIGTLSRLADKEGFKTYMMTPDKDYGQLVTENVLIYKPSLRGQDFEIRGVQQIKEKYGIQSPLQVIDLLALEGDSIDNIPGCPGIGPKTAQKLISEFGSVEKLIDSIDLLKGAVKEKIKNNSEQIIFSKFLATIKTDIPLEFSINSLTRDKEDHIKLKSIYEALEFRSLINRSGLRDLDSEPEEKTLKTEPDNGQKATPSLFDFSVAEQVTLSLKDLPLNIEEIDTNDFDVLLSEIQNKRNISLSLKSIGENAMEASLIAIGIATENNKSFILWYPSSLESHKLHDFNAFIKKIFETEGLNIITTETKRIKVLFRNLGINYKCTFFDIVLAHYLINSEERHLLPELAHQYIHYDTIDFNIEPRLRKPFDKTLIQDLPVYLGEASCVALRLCEVLKKELEKEKLLQLYEDVELPLATVLAKMEITGVRIDPAELTRLSIEYTARMEEMQQKVYEIAGISFNIGSPTQVGEVLFDRLKIDPKAKKTKTGSYSTTEENLEKYKKDHPIVDLILKIRQLRKLLTTYIDALPTLINPATGKIHTTFNQTTTTTGRLSSTNPNLQNIPVRGDEGKEIRKAFIADKGCIFMAADYNQIELRLMADFSNDPHMTNAFLNNMDIHQDTASRIFHKNIEEVTTDDRRKAKTANFGIIYGISPFGLSERLGIPRSEAKQFIEDYMLNYPSIKDYISNIIEKAKNDGYVKTFTGRKRYLNEINSRNAVVRGYGERNAVNAPLQGSAADIIKKAMVKIQDRIEAENLKSEMIMQVHDELLFNVYEEELPSMIELVKNEMENAYSGKIAMSVSIGFGENWLQAH